MAQNCNQEKCLDDPEHRPDRTFAWLIDAFALAMGALAVVHYKPESFDAGVIVFVGAHALTHALQGLNWAFLGSVSGILLAWLGVAIHFCTLLTAQASFTGLVFTFLLPGIAQAYWIWAKWATMGTLSHPVTLMCTAWLALLGIWIVARYRVVTATR